MDKQLSEDLLRGMGLTVDDFRRVMVAPNRAEAVRLLQAVKDKFRIGFKKLAITLHPDRNGGDEAKTAQFRALINLQRDIDKLEIPAPELEVPEPPVEVLNRNLTRTVVASYFPDGTRTKQVRMSPMAASKLASMSPSNVPFRKN